MRQAVSRLGTVVVVVVVWSLALTAACGSGKQLASDDASPGAADAGIDAFDGGPAMCPAGCGSEGALLHNEPCWFGYWHEVDAGTAPGPPPRIACSCFPDADMSACVAGYFRARDPYQASVCCP